MVLSGELGCSSATFQRTQSHSAIAAALEEKSVESYGGEEVPPVKAKIRLNSESSETTEQVYMAV